MGSGRSGPADREACSLPTRTSRGLCHLPGQLGSEGGRLGHGSWVLGPRRPQGARTPAGCQGRSGYWWPSVFAKILLESHLPSFFPSHRSPASLVTVTSAPEAIRLAAPGGPAGWTCFLKVKQSQQECTQVGRGPDQGRRRGMAPGRRWVLVGPPAWAAQSDPFPRGWCGPDQHSRPGDRASVCRQEPRGQPGPDGTNAAWGRPAGPPASPPATSQGTTRGTVDSGSRPGGSEAEGQRKSRGVGTGSRGQSEDLC